MHVVGEEPVSEVLRVDPAENAISEQNLNLKVNHAYFWGTPFTKKDLRCKCAHHKERELYLTYCCPIN